MSALIGLALVGRAWILRVRLSAVGLAVGLALADAPLRMVTRWFGWGGADAQAGAHNALREAVQRPALLRFASPRERPKDSTMSLSLNSTARTAPASPVALNALNALKALAASTAALATPTPDNSRQPGDPALPARPVHLQRVSPDRASPIGARAPARQAGTRSVAAGAPHESPPEPAGDSAADASGDGTNQRKIKNPRVANRASAAVGVPRFKVASVQGASDIGAVGTFFHKMDNGRAVQVTDKRHFGDEELKQLVRTLGARAGGIDRLDLSSCSHLTDAGLSHIAKLPHLKSLDLSECRHITDAGLAHLAEMVELTELTLAGCIEITDAGLALLAAMRGMEELDISSCARLTSAMVEEVVAEMPSLRRLDATGCDQVSLPLIADRLVARDKPVRWADQS